MTRSNFELPLGYSAVPKGCVAAVVTSLEMHARPRSNCNRSFPAGYKLVELDRSDLAGYRALFRKVGEDWLWHSRLTMPDKDLHQILNDPRVELCALRHQAEDAGILELDFREPGQCELAFFGLAAGHIGKGLGRALMDAALERSWAKPIQRFWVHTCTLDHPGALAFYIRSGFTPYKVQVEVQPDPRLTGHLPRHVAPNVPIIE